MTQAKLQKISPDGAASTPLYIQMANNLRQLIADGEMAIGDALPSERSLTEITGASRVTVRKAIDQLIEEGLLLRRRGAGTYIASRIEQSGEGLTSFSADARRRGSTPASIWLMKSLADPTEEEARILEIAPDEKVARLGRLRLSDDEPLAIEHAIVPARFLPSLDAVEASLYAVLEQGGFSPQTGTQKITASVATPTEAGLLSIGEGESVLRIERFTRLADGRPVEYTRSAYRGDKYVFVSELQNGPDGFGASG